MSVTKEESQAAEMEEHCGHGWAWMAAAEQAINAFGWAVPVSGESLTPACAFAEQGRHHASQHPCRLQADPVLFALFEHWPTPTAMAEADQNALERLLAPIGLGAKRSAGLITISREWLRMMVGQRITPAEVRGLKGIGPYAESAFAIFCCGATEIVPEPADRVLKVYWQNYFPAHAQGR